VLAATHRLREPGGRGGLPKNFGSTPRTPPVAGNPILARSSAAGTCSPPRTGRWPSSMRPGLVSSPCSTTRQSTRCSTTRRPWGSASFFAVAHDNRKAAATIWAFAASRSPLRRTGKVVRSTPYALICRSRRRSDRVAGSPSRQWRGLSRAVDRFLHPGATGFILMVSGLE
jgi:hypothetical protein